MPQRLRRVLALVYENQEVKVKSKEGVDYVSNVADARERYPHWRNHLTLSVSSASIHVWKTIASTASITIAFAVRR